MFAWQWSLKISGLWLVKALQVKPPNVYECTCVSVENSFRRSKELCLCAYTCLTKSMVILNNIKNK